MARSGAIGKHCAEIAPISEYPVYIACGVTLLPCVSGKTEADTPGGTLESHTCETVSVLAIGDAVEPKGASDDTKEDSLGDVTPALVLLFLHHAFDSGEGDQARTYQIIHISKQSRRHAFCVLSKQVNRIGQLSQKIDPK